MAFQWNNVAPDGPADVAQGAGVTDQTLDKEWTAFAPESGTLNVPRAEMPQVKAEHRGALVNFLKGKGIASHAAEEVPATASSRHRLSFRQKR
ncbi:Phage protein [Polaromonas sp. CG9_12]|nr:Phage protein [Polaromonas sp. CG9_12]